MINEGTKFSTGVRRNKLCWSSIVVAAITLPMLYVVSSGPMLIVAFRHNITNTTDEFGRYTAIDYVDLSVWWPRAYAPLVWVSEQSWGGPLKWYWEQFAAWRN